MKKEKEIICVGLSGGVDSSVAAKRLLERGYTVIGVFIKTWQPEFIVCNWEAERLDAMRVAAQLDIPFYTCDAEESYRKEVADYMINEYRCGRTPNPDVMCNKHVKFGKFLQFANSLGATKIATGHYANIKKNEKGEYLLYRGNDHEKDQSYFLWTLTQEQLAHIVFPIGDTEKKMIRREAVRAKLKTGTKHDSQGVCFLGPIDMRQFLSHYISSSQGTIIDESGAVIGTHEGVPFYTIGQRHGFTIDVSEKKSMPHYIIQKDILSNTITVSSSLSRVEERRIVLTDVHLISAQISEVTEAQFRYRQKPFKVHVTSIDSDSASLMVVDSNIELPAIGQSCVFYDDTRCLGGGNIQAIE